MDDNNNNNEKVPKKREENNHINYGNQTKYLIYRYDLYVLPIKALHPLQKSCMVS